MALGFFSRWFRRDASLPAPTCPPEEQKARDLLRAIDAGGLPLNPARVNHIARNLGLEVKASAPMPETIERIRAAVARMPNGN